MESKIRIGIVGYGNLGKGAVAAIRQTTDLELVAIFTRREPESLNLDDSSIQVAHISDAADYKDKIDVMLLCGGSAHDLPEQTPHFASLFNTVDSFDTHAKIPEFYKAVNEVAVKHNTTAIISVGWDPGLFSINRVMADAILPNGENYTFWGKGLSQGHSDAVRRVEGVKNGVQYTIPADAAIEKVRSGQNPELTTAEKHRRVCYIVPDEGADQAALENEIKTMPNYFADYDTEVNFITEEELKRDHSKAPHGGFVIRGGNTGDGNKQIFEFSLKLDSNPEFTASVLVAYARAAHRLSQEKQYGAKTVYDVAPGYISPRSAEELRKDFL
ncbi:diaminopimelate dehydrogenase [Bhargavaea ginsengi]|uniref:Meso-diaminopimelate D-dehydrogenase n=1 Tax=Bhargavaea ginsengi TaxID=426757 RepID=A0A1H7CDG7_9BACL|nr:diaminopimelate dehydrogenase [Bhargavaea ginsengi]MCM3088760.1 diaminopimelate dehydrogenase [Bhargavaea ginsengi]SEJ87863.1 diaminopimelate dehydrogenase [Bhargavaea ginsengi]